MRHVELYTMFFIIFSFVFSLVFQAGFLALDAADDDMPSVLGDDFVVVEHGELCISVSML